MKKLFAALAALFGLSGASASDEVKMVDPKTILFSLATINDALPALDSRHKPKPTDLILHEDDWRQFELVSRSFAEQLNAEITDIRRIYTDKRSPAGEFGAFTEIHIRKRIPQPFKKPIAWSDFTKACPVTTVSSVSFGGAPTVIANGFSVQLHGLSIYGLRHGETITTLGFVSTQTPALPIESAERLAAFLEANDLLLIHWPSATVFTDKPTLLTYLQQKPERPPSPLK
ncbi:MAG: hypothetical protein QM760_20335 [Nibricoccus sp.]